MLSGLFEIIAGLLAWIYGVVHSYGLAVVILTLIVMAVTTPLTYKGTKSMLEMQILQPQLKEIQNRYKHDREKMNQEMMAFYKEHNINPVGGCLPLLIQAPVFIILFRVVRGLTQRVTNLGLQSGLVAMQVAGATALTVADDPKRNFEPGYISKSSELYKDLSATKTMKSWGIDMSESASSAIKVSLGHALPYLGLILVVLVTGVVQQWQISKRSTGGQANPQQQMIMKIMPIFLPVFSFAMPAALVVYFVMSNLWRIGQQAFITHKFYSGEESLGNKLAAARVTAEKMAAEAKNQPKPETVESKPEPVKGTKEAAATSRAPRNVMGRNRAQTDTKVGRRLAEFEERAPSRTKKGQPAKMPSDRPQDRASKFQSGRATPKRGTEPPTEKGKK